MALNLYSKETTDTLLAAKLSISSLSNGAATNIDATAPTNGQPAEVIVRSFNFTPAP